MIYLSTCKFKDLADVDYNGDDLPKRAMIYCRAEQAIDCIKKMHADGMYILITGAGDESINSRHLPYIKDNIHHWFAQNLDIKHERVEAIPYGLASSYEGALGTQETELDMALKIPRTKKNSAMVCHGVPSPAYHHYLERKSTLDYFSDKHYCDIIMDGNHSNYVSFERVYSETRSHDYVISPTGMGFDCMRTWESIYLGAIPICKKLLYNSQFRDMPIAFVNEWSDIDEKWLEENLKVKFNNPERCYFEYWRERILQKKKEIGL